MNDERKSWLRHANDHKMFTNGVYTEQVEYSPHPPILFVYSCIYALSPSCSLTFSDENVYIFFSDV
jgi:hypothetical protein